MRALVRQTTHLLQVSLDLEWAQGARTWWGFPAGFGDMGKAMLSVLTESPHFLLVRSLAGLLEADPQVVYASRLEVSGKGSQPALSTQSGAVPVPVLVPSIPCSALWPRDVE